MIKRFFSALLVLTILLCALPVPAGAYTVSNYITDTICYTLDTERGTLTFSGTGPMPKCTLSTKNEWSRNAAASTIIIEDGITEIGAYNFYNNNYVTNVIIGDSVKVIGVSAFYNCKLLTSVDYGGELETVSDFAFSGCSALASFFFPPTLEYIGEQSFYGCTKLREIELPEGIDTIYANAFTSSGYYNSLTNGLHTLCGYTLELKGASANTTTKIPEGTKVVSIRTLTSQKNVNTLVLPASLERILFQGLYDLPALKEATIPESVTEMKDFCIGYVADKTYFAPVAQEGFLIKGRGGTEAARYAERFDFAFECLCTEEDAEYIYYPDCLTGGVAELGCKYCGKVYATEEILPAEAHHYGETLTQEATCTEDGRTYKKCVLCGYENTETTIRAAGHVPNPSPVIIPATCTEMGSIVFICSVCGKECPEQTMYLPAAGHVVPDEATVVKEATCTENGIAQKICEVCGEVVETEEIPAKGHDISGEWTVLTPSTVTGKEVGRGFRVKLCSSCGIAAEYEYYYTGDMNSDGVVNIKDIPLLKRTLAGSYDDTVAVDNADFNGDGVISVTDIKDLKQFMTS